jgi:hypothetical protein
MKKLLLILLCLPMIGFGQVDKIIFSSGDTIYGKVIEVGVNNIKYQHKGETTNNISKKRDIAKVIYSSGRIETFQGLRTLEAKIEKEENDKLYLQQKEERVQRRKELSKKTRNSKFAIGVVCGVSLNNSTGLLDWPIPEGNGNTLPISNAKSLTNIKMIEGISINYLISNNISIYSKILYHTSGYTRATALANDGAQFFSSPDLTFNDCIHPEYGFCYPYSEDIVYPDYVLDKHKHFDYYLTLPITLQYNYKSLFVNAGGYFAYLLKSEDNLFDEISDNAEKLDLGLTLGIGFNYELNYFLDISFEVSSLYGLTDFYSDNNPNTLQEFYKRSYIGMFGLIYNLEQ